MEKGRVRELRHDFRRIYGVCYDDVYVDEAVDLIATLPAGSLYMASMSPELAWPAWRQALADLQDDVWAASLASAGYRGDMPRVPRPQDAPIRARERERAAAAKSIIEETKWVAVE